MQPLNPVMACGHAANAIDQDGAPACAICWGRKPGADQVIDTPELAGRRAKCMYCANTADSTPALAFFGWRRGEAQDEYYCGCQGWD